MLNTEAKPKIVVAFNGFLLGNCAVWLIYIILILGNMRKHLEGMWWAEDNWESVLFACGCQESNSGGQACMSN